MPPTLEGGGHGEENQLSSCSPSNAAQSLMLHVTSKGRPLDAITQLIDHHANCVKPVTTLLKVCHHHGIRPLPHRFEQHVGVEQNVHASF